MTFGKWTSLVLTSMLIARIAIGASFFQHNGLVIQGTETASSGGTLTLVALSNQVQVITGSTTHTVALPSGTTVPSGWYYDIDNESSGTVTVKDSASSTVATLKAGTWARVWIPSNSSATGNWRTKVQTQEASIDVTLLQNISTDFATQYLNTTRGDARYYKKTEFVGTFTGLSGEPIKTNSSGFIDSTLIPSSLGVTGPGSATDNAIVRFDGVTGGIVQNSSATISDAGTLSATAFSGPLTGNASTATALASNPTDCGVGTKAISIDASGNLTCSAVSLTADVSGTLPNANTTASATAGNSTIVARDGSGNFAAGTVTASLTGLASLNLPLTGGTMSGAIAMGTSKITGLGDPTAAQDAATKTYVDTAVVNEGVTKTACNLATAAALPSIIYDNGSSGVGATLTGAVVGALTIDGTLVSVGQRILVKDQVSTLQNGIYTVTATGSGIAVFVLTRATDFNQASEIIEGASSFVLSGTANASTTWDLNVSTPLVVGTDAITFAQTSGPGSITSGTGITVTGVSVALTSPVTVSLGGTGRTSLTNHGLLVGASTTAITQLSAAGGGTLLGGVASSDPAFTLTPTLGLAGTGTGSLGFAGTTSGTVTVQPQAAAGTYNFNLPTSAGTSGQPLLSGGGSSSAQTYGTLGIAAGGTGQVTAQAAIDALLPSQGSNSGKFLTTNGSASSWASSSASAGGSTTQVQYNNAGALGGDAGFIFLATSTRVGIGVTPAQTLDLSGTLSYRSTSVNWVGNIPDLGTATTTNILMTGGATATIQGLTGGSDGKIVKLINGTARQLFLNDQDGAATAANRIVTGASNAGGQVAVATGSSVELTYDATNSRWRTIGNVLPMENQKVVFSAGITNVAETGGATVTGWTQTNKDSHGGFVASTGIYTIKVSGDYWVDIHAMFNNNSNINCQVYVGTTLTLMGGSRTNAGGTCSAAGILPNLVVGNTVSIRMESSGTFDDASAVRSVWSMFKIN